MHTGDITAHKYNRYLDGDFLQHFYICKNEIDKQKNKNTKQKQSLCDKIGKCWLEYRKAINGTGTILYSNIHTKFSLPIHIKSLEMVTIWMMHL